MPALNPKPAPVTVEVDADLAERLRCIVEAGSGCALPLRSIVHALLCEAAERYERRPVDT
jgi:hypothetical protein